MEGMISKASKGRRPRKKVNKLNKYFKKVPKSKPPVEKVKRPPTKKNFQGFAMSKCFYIEEVEKHCYMTPKWYGENFNPKDPDEFEAMTADFCPHCYLGGCFLSVFGSKMEEECLKHSELQRQMIERGELVVTEAQRVDDIKQHLLEWSQNMLGSLFNKTYAKRNGPPQCALEYIEDKLELEEGDQLLACAEQSNSDDDSSDEEEFLWEVEERTTAQVLEGFLEAKQRLMEAQDDLKKRFKRKSFGKDCAFNISTSIMDEDSDNDEEEFV